jgi:hypothetical protein
MCHLFRVNMRMKHDARFKSLTFSDRECIRNRFKADCFSIICYELKSIIWNKHKYLVNLKCWYFHSVRPYTCRIRGCACFEYVYVYLWMCLVVFVHRTDNHHVHNVTATSTVTAVTLRDLTPYTLYSVCMQIVTRAGIGSSSRLYLVDSGGEYYFHTWCYEWMGDS